MSEPLGPRLEELALLDRRLDPRGETFDRLLRPILRPRYITTQAHREVRQVGTG